MEYNNPRHHIPFAVYDGKVKTLPDYMVDEFWKLAFARHHMLRRFGGHPEQYAKCDCIKVVSEQLEIEKLYE